MNDPQNGGVEMPTNRPLYDLPTTLYELYEKLSLAEAESEAGLGEDFEEFAIELRESLESSIF